MKNIDTEITELINSDESTTLEFKREWYWNDSTTNTQKEKAWGELLKDLIALANSHPESFTQDRFLIVGIDENSKDLWNVDLDLNLIKSEISKKIPQYTNIDTDYLIKFDLKYKKINDKKILVIKIPQPPHIISTTKNIQTHTINYPVNSILMRGSAEKKDEVGLANLQHIKQFNINFSTESKTIENEIIDPQVTHRTIKITMQEYLKLNHNLNNFSKDYPKFFKDSKKKVFYEVYCFKDEFNSIKKFIYIHDQATQQNTYTHLKNEKEISENMMILTDRPHNIKDTERRISNLKNTFKNQNVYFIDQFGRNFVYRRLLEQFKLDKFYQEVYIESFAFESIATEKKTGIQVLEDWYNKVNEPIFIVQGDGGIGKTTLVQHFLNKIIDKKKEEVQILFIDSSQIIKELNNSSNKINIYDFYKAKNQSDIKNTGASIDLFTEDLLRISVDDGNVIIVLDGIDEVISSLGSSFNISNFIKNIINDYSFNLCRCKIIITCRNHFWGEVEVDNSNIKFINLLPFTEEQAKDFFSQSLEATSTSLIQKSLNFARKFTTSENEDSIIKTISYSPFVLDTILYLAKKDGNFLEQNYSETDSSIKYLSLSKSSNDFLIYTVFEREFEKLKQLNSEEQLRFFINLAALSNGEASITQLSTIYGENLDDARVNSLMAHPFLRSKEGNIKSVSFKYDFFNSLFKGIYITKCLHDKELTLINDNFFKVINSMAGFDNSITKAISERLTLDSELELFFIDIIQKIKKTTSNEDNFHANSISSTFLLYLSILKSNNRLANNDQLNNALYNIFKESENRIEGLSLINVKNVLSKKIVFDFSDHEIINSTFIDYDFFWDCNFNQNTKFINCNLSLISSKNFSKKNPLTRSNFIDCRIDYTLNDAFNKIAEVKLSNKDKVRKDVIGILKLFSQNLNFYPQKEARIKSFHKYSELYQKLFEIGVIQRHDGKLNEPEVMISKEYKKLIKCITQRSPLEELDAIVDELTK